jgi:hypothetical protein
MKCTFAGFLLCFASFGVLAGGADFSDVDTNQDGYISPSEDASANLRAAFVKRDRNGDGRLDESEFSAFDAIASNVDEELMFGGM